jgi:uncharacterized membrane protein (DUF2068 family)
MGTKKHHDMGFLAIAIFKLVKGLVLLLVGVGAVSLMRKDTTAVVTHWAHVFQVDMHSKLIQRWLLKVGLMRHRDLAVVAFFYSALLFTEGIGLLMEKVWAEYMTAIITGSFIPIEVYELIRRVTVIRGCVLLANVLVVTYLVMRLCQRKRSEA